MSKVVQHVVSPNNYAAGKPMQRGCALLQLSHVECNRSVTRLFSRATFVASRKAAHPFGQLEAKSCGQAPI